MPRHPCWPQGTEHMQRTHEHLLTDFSCSLVLISWPSLSHLRPLVSLLSPLPTEKCPAVKRSILPLRVNYAELRGSSVAPAPRCLAFGTPHTRRQWERWGAATPNSVGSRSRIDDMAVPVSVLALASSPLSSSLVDRFLPSGYSVPSSLSQWSGRIQPQPGQARILGTDDAAPQSPHRRAPLASGRAASDPSPARPNLPAPKER